MNVFIDRLKESLKLNPRKVKIIYYNPLHPKFDIVPRSCIKDEGRSFEIELQDLISNNL